MSVYSLEDRTKAVDLYFKYGGNVAAVVRGLGYPGKNTLRQWVREYKSAGTLHDGYRDRVVKYSKEQKQAAVDYYLEHRRGLRWTVQALGYPKRESLRQWVNEATPDRHRLRTGRSLQTKVEFTPEQKRAAVLDLGTRDGAAREVAEEYGVTRAALYKWKNDLLGKEHPVGKHRKPKLSEDKEALEAKVESLKEQVETLEKQVYRLRLEKDVLEATAEVLKKGPGADLKKLTNREKAVVIGALGKSYPLDELLGCFSMPKSSYFYHHAVLSVPEKHAELRKQVRAAFAQVDGRYGYRRLHAVLTKDGRVVSEKVIRRLMREGNLVVVGQKKRRYSSYKGEITPAVPNVIERDFHADAPNIKWLSDLTEFPPPAGKVYLSPMIDCFDGLVVSWSIGTSPDAELVDSMLDNAISTLIEDERPVVHTDRGSHYRWPGWIDRMYAAGLTRSMSKKGCSPDNAACEGFFGRLKNEFFYGRSWIGVSLEEFMDKLDRYIHWYNEERIKMSVGGRSPMEYRRSLGYST